MADVVVLGSGTPIPDPQRAGSAVAVVADEGWLLVDCGRAATQRALAAGLDLTAVVAVALTHHHSDHVSDLATFATARWTAGATSPLAVVAPAGPTARYAERCLGVFDDESFYGQAPAAAGPRPAIAVQAFDPADELSLVHASGRWRTSSVLVHHPPVAPAVGYLVEHDGETVAVSGDTAVCEGMRRLAHGADVLVHEALLTDRVSRGLLEWNAGARAVGELAAEAGVHTLVLTHLIPAPSSATEERAYVDDVRAGGFAGPTLVAHDLLRTTIRPHPARSDLYRDRWIRCTPDELVIRCYSFPLGRAKRIAYRDIREVTVHEMGWLTGKGRIWGTATPGVWASFDPARPWKSKALVLGIGRRVRPFVTPDDPDAVRAIIESRR